MMKPVKFYMILTNFDTRLKLRSLLCIDDDYGKIAII